MLSSLLLRLLCLDPAWHNLLHTLYAGACLCIPSKYERDNDVSGSIVRLDANFTDITPKVAEMLTPQALERLEILQLAGETADIQQVRRMRAQTNIVRFAYGPAECSVMATMSCDESAALHIDWHRRRH